MQTHQTRRLLRYSNGGIFRHWSPNHAGMVIHDLAETLWQSRVWRAMRGGRVLVPDEWTDGAAMELGFEKKWFAKLCMLGRAAVHTKPVKNDSAGWEVEPSCRTLANPRLGNM